MNGTFVLKKCYALQFRKFPNQKLKDKFVTGLVRGTILDRRCEEEPNRTLTDLVEITRKKEASTSQSSEVSMPINRMTH